MFKVTGMGRLVRDVNIGKATNGQTVATFDLAVENRYGVSYLPVEVWEKSAEACAKYLKKGSQIFVEGDAVIKVFTRKDGRKGMELKLQSPQIEFVNSRYRANKEEAAGGMIDETQEEK